MDRCNIFPIRVYALQWHVSLFFWFPLFCFDLSVFQDVDLFQSVHSEHSCSSSWQVWHYLAHISSKLQVSPWDVDQFLGGWTKKYIWEISSCVCKTGHGKSHYTRLVQSVAQCQSGLIFYFFSLQPAKPYNCSILPDLLSVLTGQPQTRSEHRPGGGLVQPYSSRWTLPNDHHWTQMEPEWVPFFIFRNPSAASTAATRCPH